MAFPTNIAKRRLLRALYWSLALHGLVLGGVMAFTPGGQSSSRGRAPMPVARLVTWQSATSSVVESSRETASRREARPSTRDRQSGTGAAGRPQQRAIPSALPASGQGGDNGVDEGDLRAFRLALAVGARPHWRYPADARRAEQAGTVEVRVAVTTAGAGFVSVEKSSGYPALDGAAVEMLRAATSRVSRPEGLRGKAFSLVIPVVFDLAGSP